MKVLYYLIGALIILYLVVLFYENKREKEFVKQDLEAGGITFVDSLNDNKLPSVLMKENAIVQTSQKMGTTILDQMDRTFQDDVKRVVDDVKGAVPLRRN